VKTRTRRVTEARRERDS